MLNGSVQWRACPRVLTVYVHGVLAILSFVHRVLTCALTKRLFSEKSKGSTTVIHGGITYG